MVSWFPSTISLRMSKFQPYVQSITRVVVSFPFVLHGTVKLLGLFGGLDGHGAAGQFPTMIWWAGALETVLGTLFAVGLFTRAVAFVLCGEMAFAYFFVHARQGFWPIQNGGELAVLYCFVFLFYTVAGPGAWSLDRLRGAK